MKKQILLLAGLCSAFILKAGDQTLAYNGGGNNDSKLTIGVSVGAGIPMGAYGSKKADTASAVRNDSTHRQNGFASTGFHFDVTAGYRFAGPLGAMVYIGGNMNSFDATTYASVNNIKSPEAFAATNYYLGQYLVGPFLSLPAGDKLKIDVRLLVGLVTCNTPTETESAGSQSYISSGNGGSGFGYQLGAGIKYNMSDKIGLTVNVAYTGASVAYTGYTVTEAGTYYTGTITNTTLKSTMSVGLLTATVGVAFNL